LSLKRIYEKTGLISAKKLRISKSIQNTDKDGSPHDMKKHGGIQADEADAMKAAHV